MIRYFAKHPTAANLLMLAFLVAGALSAARLRRETFPDFNPREVEVLVIYPGATAEEVEESICQRVEDALDGVRFVEEVRCDAREGRGVVTVEMVEGGDFIAFKDEIDTAVNSIDDFPDRAEEPTVEELNTTDPVMTILVAGDMTPADLKLYAEGLKDRLQALDGVSLINVQGFSEHQLRVEVNSDALLRHGLSPDDVADAIQRQSVDLPAGTVEARAEEVQIRFTEERTTADALAELVVLGGGSGDEVRVRDIGRVVDDFKRAEEKVTLGGRRAAMLQVKKVKTEDAIDVADTVLAFLDEERAKRPAVELVVTQDQSRLVRDRLGMLLKNGWQGMILVFFAMWLFFNTRLSLWVVAALPVSFLGAFVVLPAVGVSINMMSMVGLLLAIGILMDDGIVIAENIASHRERGKSGLAAAVDGVAEVGPGVVASFLTTASVLGPLAFLSGNIGRVLEVVPLILLLVLGVSLVEAFLILPNHLSHSLSDVNEEPGRFRRAVEGFLGAARNRVIGPLVKFLVRWRYAWVGCVVMTLLASVALLAGGVLKLQALPELEGDTGCARVLMPQGTPLGRTEEVVERLRAAARRVNERFKGQQPGGRDLIEHTYTKFSENQDAFEAGPHVATVYVDLLSAEERTVRLDDLFAAWREEAGPAAGALAVTYTEPTFGPAGRNLEIQVIGDGLPELRGISLEIRAWLQRFPGVSNVTEDLRPGKREYRIRFRPGALGLGLDSARMAGQLRAAFQGRKTAEIQVGAESYEIEVRFDGASRDDPADLENFRFTLPSGGRVPLSAIATVEEGTGWSRIARVERRRTVTLRGDVDARKSNTEGVLAQLRTDLLPKLREKHPEIEFKIEGESAEAAKTRGAMIRGMMIGVIGVFILLSYQFRSYAEPLIVMAAIPMSLIGVLWGTFLLGMDFTMPGILGFISLAGIVVNDSILLVIFLKAARERGEDPIDAAAEASRSRFRAILITSLTTVAGLLPLLFETSLQAQILIPLAVSIVFGLLASTCLVLLVIPCLYVILDDFGLATAKPATDSGAD